jgi:hypothetical protein
VVSDVVVKSIRSSRRNWDGGISRDLVREEFAHEVDGEGRG